VIQLPIWAAVLLVGLLPIVGLGCYWYGWKLRDQHGTRTVRVERKSSPMTPEQRRHFDTAFDHMGRAFEEMDKVFDRG
jgi:hypothetical protein